MIIEESAKTFVLLFVILLIIGGAVVGTVKEEKEESIVEVERAKTSNFTHVSTDRIGGEWLTVVQDTSTNKKYLIVSSRWGVSVVELKEEEE